MTATQIHGNPKKHSLKKHSGHNSPSVPEHNELVKKTLTGPAVKNCRDPVAMLPENVIKYNRFFRILNFIQ